LRGAGTALTVYTHSLSFSLPVPIAVEVHAVLVVERVDVQDAPVLQNPYVIDDFVLHAPLSKNDFRVLSFQELLPILFGQDFVLGGVIGDAAEQV